MAGTDSTPHLLTPQEAADYLRLPKRTLEYWRMTGGPAGVGAPRFVRLGKRVAYRKAALDDFLDRAERTCTSDPGPGAEGTR